MQRLVEWLFDLENIRLGKDAPLVLQWERAVPAWVLFCFALVALGCIVLAYRRERTTATRRTILAALRCAAAAVTVGIVSQPILVLQRNRVEPSQVVLLVDTSLSMMNKDLAGVEEGPQSSERQSRLEGVKSALGRDSAAVLRRLLERHAVQLSTFSSGVEGRFRGEGPRDLGGLAEQLGALEAEGSSTDVPGAIATVLKQTQGGRLAAIILASDGQSTQEGSIKEVVEEATGRQIPIYALRVGSAIRVGDVELGRVRSLDRVFVKDLMAVEGQVSATSLSEPVGLRVSLIEEGSGAALASETVSLTPQAPSANVELRAKATSVGPMRVRVEVESLPGEFNVENNVDYVDVEVIDDHVRVLYVDGYPRYEYRYLKNALLREPSIELSVLLLEADENFVQEGSEPIRRFPETPEELNRFDVVLFGDIDPRSGWLTAAQMNMILDYVGNEGGGFALIAGERWAPRRFQGTPLEKLVPVELDAQSLPRSGALTSGFRPRLTLDGEKSRVFRFAASREESRAIFEGLPELYWAARSLGPRPGATVLLEHPLMQAEEKAMPIAVLGRYGAGKVYFQATDDTWRWRRHTGELLHDSYWLQVVRELMRSRGVGQDRRYAVRSDRRIYPYGAAVRIELEITDSQLLAQLGDSVEAEVRMEASGTGSSSLVAHVNLTRLRPDSHVFEGTFVPPREGMFVVSCDRFPQRPGEKAAMGRFRVRPPDLEWKRPEADHATLEALTSSTGGKLLDLNAVTEELGNIPDRSLQIPDDIVEPLWDSKLALLLFVGLMTVEWVLRKAFGLV